MRLGFIVALLITLGVATGVVQDLNPSARAQDATPAAGQQTGAPEGVSIATLASGSIDVFEPGTFNLALGRIRLAPGAAVLFDPTDPSVDLVYMTGGALTFRMDAPMTVARTVGSGTPVPSEPEEIAANTEFTLRDGDSALFPPATAGEVRNDGDEEATAWLANFALRSAAVETPTP